MVLGQGEHRYELVENWEQLPEGFRHGDVAGVSTDSQDRVYVFNRSEHPLLVFNRDGSFIKSWGEGIFTRPHGITIDNDIVYLADDSDHTVRKFTLDGELLQTLGTPNEPSDTGYAPERTSASLTTITHGGGPFNRPTRLSVSRDGELYVSDGYGNARIHRFSAEGELLQSWGGPGTRPGEFNLPHSVWAHTDGRVFVCDRENNRIQIFGPHGDFLEEWTNLYRPGDLFIDEDLNVYVGEMNFWKDHYSLTGFRWPENRMARITVRDINGNLKSEFGAEVSDGDPCAPSKFTSPHGIWVDSHGDIYVGEVSQTSYEGTVYRPGCHSLQKFRRV
jgi:DNA-binding beta-propeller fold protein YncE